MFFLILRKNGVAFGTHEELLMAVIFTTICWVAAAYLGPETDRETLISFYHKVRPFGPGWAPIRALAHDVALAEGAAVEATRTCRWRCSAGSPAAP